MIETETFQIAPSPSPHMLWIYFIRSTDLHMPLHVQSNDATQAFPALVFNSQSGGVPQQKLLSSTCSTSKPSIQAPRETSSFAYLCKIGLQIKTMVEKSYISLHINNFVTVVNFSYKQEWSNVFLIRTHWWRCMKQDP